MTTEKQLEANKENAQLSTGPKTAEGMAISRFNAMKHGLLSKEILLEDEDEQELAELGKHFRAELEPATHLEQILVDRVVANSWRLARVLRIERGMIDDDRRDTDFNGKAILKNVGRAVSYDFSNHDTYGKLIRYESSIERGLYKALHELQRLQAVRNGEKILPPVAVDIDISKEE